jgi:tetratricopeptide (TPR) repeat protein
MFPNLPSMRFEKKVHENLESAIAKLSMTIVSMEDVVVGHFGYCTPEIRKQKAIRNLEILAESDPQDAGEFAQIGDALYSMGKLLVGVGFYAEAVRLGGELAEKNLADKLCIGYLAAGAFEKAEEIVNKMPAGTAMRYFFQAELYRARGDRANASAFYRMVRSGVRSLAGRDCNYDSLVAQADLHIAEMEAQCSPA